MCLAVAVPAPAILARAAWALGGWLVLVKCMCDGQLIMHLYAVSESAACCKHGSQRSSAQGNGQLLISDVSCLHDVLQTCCQQG